ncbi:MAG: Mth938-like domain-containing protein [Pseudomonadota bacterium]
MKLIEIDYDAAKPIDSYGDGFFRVAGEVHEGPMLILPDAVLGWGGYSDTAALVVNASKIDVLFVGTGAEIAHIPKELRAALEEAGLGVEQMSTPSACRTYNVLLSEGRRIGAALLPV